MILLSALLIACRDGEIIKVETWSLDSFESEISCLFITDSLEEEDIIVDTFLGVEDLEYLETELRLADDGEFQIVKDGQVVLVGNWDTNRWETLRLVTENQEWFVEVKAKNDDSLVLRFNGYYKYLNNLRMTLRHVRHN